MTAARDGIAVRGTGITAGVRIGAGCTEKPGDVASTSPASWLRIAALSNLPEPMRLIATHNQLATDRPDDRMLASGERQSRCEKR